MAHIPQGYLAKKGRKWLNVRLSDLVTLLYNISQGAREGDVGFEDADNTLTGLLGRLGGHKVLVDPSVLESALWSCNLMDEAGKFWDIKGRSIQSYIKDILGGDARFDMIYHTIHFKRKKRK